MGNVNSLIEENYNDISNNISNDIANDISINKDNSKNIYDANNYNNNEYSNNYLNTNSNNGYSNQNSDNFNSNPVYNNYDYNNNYENNRITGNSNDFNSGTIGNVNNMPTNDSNNNVNNNTQNVNTQSTNQEYTNQNDNSNSSYSNQQTAEAGLPTNIDASYAAYSPYQQSYSPVYIPESNNNIQIETTHDDSISFFDWIDNTVFSINDFKITYLYIIIASVSVVLLLLILILICVIRRKRKIKRKHMTLVDISNASNLRKMLDETTISQDDYNDDEYHEYRDYCNKERNQINEILKNEDNNDVGITKTNTRINSETNVNNYQKYQQNFSDFPEKPKPFIPTLRHFNTLPNPKAAHSTGKTIDAYTSNYNRISTPIFPTSSDQTDICRNSSVLSSKHDYEFDSGYNFYSQNMKLNKSMVNSYNSKNKPYKKSPMSNATEIDFEDSSKSKISSDYTIDHSKSKTKTIYTYKLNNSNNSNNNSSSTNSNKNQYNDKNYIKDLYDNNNNNNSNNNDNNNNNNFKLYKENNINNDNDDNYNVQLYPQNYEYNNNNNNNNKNNGFRNLFMEGKYFNTMPYLSNNPTQFNEMKMNGKSNSLKRKPVSEITIKDNYPFNNNNMNNTIRNNTVSYPLDFLYKQPQQLNTIAPARNSVPSYMIFDNNLNTVNKMVTPTTRLTSTPVSSNNYMNNDNIVYSSISMLNDEELISEQSRYPVDQDYHAIYSYQPVVSDELFITINDRIHLLQTYSDGWAYGKNVTTNKLGVFPLNRLSCVKKEGGSKSDIAKNYTANSDTASSEAAKSEPFKISSIKRNDSINSSIRSDSIRSDHIRYELVKSDYESEKTKVNMNSNNDIVGSLTKRISYSLPNLQRKNASQETLIDFKSNSHTDSSSYNIYSSNSISRVKPKKSRTLIIRNFSEEDLRDKSSSMDLSEKQLELNEFEKTKDNKYSHNRKNSEKSYFNNLFKNYKMNDYQNERFKI